MDRSATFKESSRHSSSDLCSNCIGIKTIRTCLKTSNTCLLLLGTSYETHRIAASNTLNGIYRQTIFSDL